MTHTRRNPSQLVDPKVSVVIPVYDEKNTICEILRRVEEADMRKEIVVVDDCSKDGTREILQDWRRGWAGEMARRRRAMTKTRSSCGTSVSFFKGRIREREQHCGGASLWRPEILCWCRMRTSSTTRATIPSYWRRSWKAVRMWCTAHGSWAG